MRPSLPKVCPNLLSIVSVPICWAIICLLCTIYILLSIFSSLFIQKPIITLSFTSLPTNITILANITKLTSNDDKNLTKDINNLNNNSFICDYGKTNNTHRKTTTSSFEDHRLNALR
ncbi:unnamed protein product, partial [Rotaria sp. Silwood2]